jgi:hypothetical protein
MPELIKLEKRKCRQYGTEQYTYGLYNPASHRFYEVCDRHYYFVADYISEDITAIGLYLYY